MTLERPVVPKRKRKKLTMDQPVKFSPGAVRSEPPETCICAAIRLDDGEVFRGHRHDDAIHTAGKAGVERERISTAEQGFITSLHRFVGRVEGAQLQRAAGIDSVSTGKPVGGPLFSEDLYLRRTNGMPRAALTGESRATHLCQAVPSADSRSCTLPPGHSGPHQNGPVTWTVMGESRATNKEQE